MNLGNLHEQSDIKIKIICHLSPKPKTKNHLVEPGSCKVSDANRSKFEKKKKKNGMEQSLPSVLLKVSSGRLSLTNVARVQQLVASSFPRKFIGLPGLESGASLKYRQACRIENMTNEQRLSRAGKKLKVNFNRIREGGGGRGWKYTRWNKSKHGSHKVYAIGFILDLGPRREEDTLLQPGSRFVTSVSVIFTGITR